MTSPSLSLGLFDAVCSLQASALARVLRERDVIAPVSPGPWDLARLLSTPTAVTSQLRSLSAAELTALDRVASGEQVEGAALPSEATHRLLLTTHGTLRPELEAVWPEIRSLLEHSTPPQLPTAGELAPVDSATIVASAEGIETVIKSLRGQPLAAELSSDADAWSKRLGREETGPARALALVDIAQRAGLLGIDQDHLVVTGRGEDYTLQPLRQRLLDVASALWSQLPSWWTAAALDIDSPSSSEWAWPLVEAEPWNRWMERCQLVGLASAGQPTALAAAFRDSSDARAVLDQALPDPSDQLYPDGPDSVVAAGVLSDERERQLRRIARWHSGGLAARFVISPSSVVAALQSGVAADEIRQFLTEAIPGGTDSPLSHLVNESIAKAQALSLHGSESESTLVVNDEMTRQLLLSDRRLAALGLAATDDSALHSQLPRDRVRETLLSEGYPVLVTSTDGQLLPLHDGERQECAARGAGWNEADTTALMTRWDALRTDSAEQWFGPVIGAAIDTGGPLELTVDTGQEHMTMSLELRSVSNGRLRARDIRSDVERTIPVNRIVSIAPLPVPSSQS